MTDITYDISRKLEDIFKLVSTHQPENDKLLDDLYDLTCEIDDLLDKLKE